MPVETLILESQHGKTNSDGWVTFTLTPNQSIKQMSFVSFDFMLAQYNLPIGKLYYNSSQVSIVPGFYTAAEFVTAINTALAASAAAGTTMSFSEITGKFSVTTAAGITLKFNLSTDIQALTNLPDTVAPSTTVTATNVFNARIESSLILQFAFAGLTNYPTTTVRSESVNGNFTVPVTAGRFEQNLFQPEVPQRIRIKTLKEKIISLSVRVMSVLTKQPLANNGAPWKLIMEIRK